jgi:sulfate adenylyltransferase subunit 1 (EFTu-like GTPase family)
MSSEYDERKSTFDELPTLVRRANLVVDENELESLARRVSILHKSADKLSTALITDEDEREPGITFDPRWHR